MTFYITTPIFYVNDAPHIGHAYTTVAADVLARWHRARQEDVWFLTGTDEHGQKVMRTALENDTAPQEWVDRLVTAAWRPMLEQLNVSNDDFIRTTEQRHVERVKVFLQRMYDAGHIYQGSYEGYYSVRSEEFVHPDEVGEDEAGEKISTRTGEHLEWLSESNYFFKLSNFQDQLLELYESDPNSVQPASARNEVINFVRQGLQDLSISRNTFDWGIDLPWDNDDHVLYVWFDALLNYVTALGWGSDEASEQQLYDKFWPANIHLVGKDILRFHAVIWPAMLMAAGMQVPKTVFAHGWLLVGGEKMSKSKLNGIAPAEIIDTFGLDAFRYYFLRAITFGSDGSFSWEDIAARYEAELANGLGNLASRVAGMMEKYFGGLLPAEVELTAAESELQALVASSVQGADEAIDRIAPHEAIRHIWHIVEGANGYLAQVEPWHLAKDESQLPRLAGIMSTAAHTLRTLAILLGPLMPETAEKLWEMLGGQAHLGELSGHDIRQAADFSAIADQTPITKGAALFPRLDIP